MVSRWMYFSLFILYGFLLGPFIIIFMASFGANANLAFPPEGFTLDWFANVFETSQFIDSFWISLQLALMSTLVSLIMGMPVAYALVRFDFAGAGLVETVFSAPILVPGLVIGFAMLNFFVLLGDMPVLTGLFIGHTAILFPYSVRVISASLRNLDPYVEDAAVSLGANRLRGFSAGRAAQYAGRHRGCLCAGLYHLIQQCAGLALPQRTRCDHAARLHAQLSRILF